MRKKVFTFIDSESSPRSLVMSRYDIIIFGASGFTGKFTIEALEKVNKITGSNLRYAVAGRSEEKLKSALGDVQLRTGFYLSKVPIIIADVYDEKSIKEMAKKAKVVINCVGPFVIFGEPVVKACIEEGTHHVDVTGEPIFINRMLMNYNEKAREKNVYIVNACGLECLIRDMGIVYLQENFPGTLHSVEVYAQVKIDGIFNKKSLMNKGSWRSVVHHSSSLFTHLRLLKKIEPKNIPKCKPDLKKRYLPHRVPAVDGVAIAVPVAEPMVIQRSQAYFYENYKKRPVKSNFYTVFDSYLIIILVGFFSLIMALFSQFSVTRDWLLKYPRYFTLGYVSDEEEPSPEDMEKTSMTYTFFGEGWKDKVSKPDEDRKAPLDQRIVGRIKGQNAYSVTCISIVLAAKMILTQKDKLPPRGGVYTPAAVFAKTTIINEMEECGIDFDLISIPTNVSFSK